MRHGTISGYNKHKCRCDECRAYKRAHDKRYYESNPAKLEQKRASRAADPARDLAQQRARRAADPDRFLNLNRGYRAANPERYRAHAQTRRALKCDAFVEHVDPLVVFERDAFGCQDCGITCPADAKWPDKTMATVDHIVALVNGGEHSYANTQTLCLSCNSRKRDRPNKTPPVCDAGRNDAHRVTTITAS